MDSDNKKRKIKNISFEFFEDREKEFHKYLCILQKHIDLNKKIPTIIISKITSILDEVRPEQDFGSKIIINTVFEKFNNKNYYFKGKIKCCYKDIPPLNTPVFFEQSNEPYYLKSDLKLLIEYTVESVYGKYSLKNTISKDECITDIFRTINQYCDCRLNKANQKFLTPYKRLAITSFITIQFGFHLFDNRKIVSNHDLFEKADKIIKKKRIID